MSDESKNTKRCCDCGEHKPHDQFNKNRSRKDGRQDLCKVCHRESNRQWAKRNPEKHCEHSRRWQLANPDHHRASQALHNALERGSHIPSNMTNSEIIAETRDLYAKAVRLTKTTGIKHEVDHVIPIGFGGLHCSANLEIVTKEENLKRAQNWKDYPPVRLVINTGGVCQ